MTKKTKTNPTHTVVDLWEYGHGLVLVIDERDPWWLHDDPAASFVQDAHAILKGDWYPCTEDGQRPISDDEWRELRDDAEFQHVAGYRLEDGLLYDYGIPGAAAGRYSQWSEEAVASENARIDARIEGDE